MTLTRATGVTTPADVWCSRVRAALLGGGAAALLLATAVVAMAMRAGRAPGPLQLQMAGAGLALLAAGMLRAPARVIGGALSAAQHRGPVDTTPLTARGRAGLAVIALLALIFRVGMAETYWRQPANQIVMGMTLWDAEMGRNLLAGRGWVLNWGFVERVDRALVQRGAMVDPQDYLPADDSRPGALATFRDYPHTPGYAVWLAASFALGRAQRFVYSQWMQSALDAAACLLVFGIARRLWSNTAGWIGALLYALSPAHVYLAIQTVTAATDSFWLLLIGFGSVRLWHDLQHERSPWPGVLAVTLGGFGGTVMNSAAFVLPLVAAAWAVVIGTVERPVWRVVPFLIAAQVALVLLLTPWALRNQRVYGQLAFTRQTFWQFAWETLGGVPNPWGLAMGNNDEVYWNWVHQHCTDPCAPAEREALTRRDLLTRVIASAAFPAHMVRLVAHQAPGLIYTSRLPADKPYVGAGVAGRAAAAALATLNLAALLIWPATLVGLLLVTLRRASAAGAWLGLATTLFVLAFSLAFLVEPRRTTTAYGYCLALCGIAGASLLEPRAEDY